MLFRPQYLCKTATQLHSGNSEWKSQLNRLWVWVYGLVFSVGVCLCVKINEHFVFLWQAVLISRCQHRCNKQESHLGETTELYEPIRCSRFYHMWNVLFYQTNTHACSYLSSTFPPIENIFIEIHHRFLKDLFRSAFGSCQRSDFPLFDVTVMCFLLPSNMCPSLRLVMLSVCQNTSPKAEKEGMRIASEGKNGGEQKGHVKSIIKAVTDSCS